MKACGRDSLRYQPDQNNRLLFSSSDDVWEGHEIIIFQYNQSQGNVCTVHRNLKKLDIYLFEQCEQGFREMPNRIPSIEHRSVFLTIKKKRFASAHTENMIWCLIRKCYSLFYINAESDFTYLQIF